MKISETNQENDSDIPRKLLILDLNGTLLRRSARSSVTKHGLRPVYPRPYLPSFREYIFHERTKEWLDTMIWSSAQPHSVADMVKRCFGEDEIVEEPVEKRHDSDWSLYAKTRRLAAVWARDTLGLTSDEYSAWASFFLLEFRLLVLVGNKTPTVKDLVKPWKFLSTRDTSSFDTPETPGAPEASTSTHNVLHSARSTLLVDDSPEKAVRQPFNHVCFKEYDGTAWRDSMQAKRRQGLLAKPLLSEPNLNYEHMTPRQRKVAENKRRHDEEDRNSTTEMDEFLLALIGILDTIKDVGNVAGWVRSGGLSALKDKGQAQTDVQDALEGVHREPNETEDAVLPNGETENEGNQPVNPPRSASPLDVMIANHKARLRSHSPPPASLPNLSSIVVKTGNDLKMWYDDSRVFKSWVEKGKSVLKNLDIDIIDGVDGSIGQ